MIGKTTGMAAESRGSNLMAEDTYISEPLASRRPQPVGFSLRAFASLLFAVAALSLMTVPLSAQEAEPAGDEPVASVDEADDAGDEAGGEGEFPGDEDLAEAAAAGAESTSPIQLDKWNDAHSFPRSSTGYISWLWALLTVVALCIWVRTADWINRDAQHYELGHGTWNPITLAAGLVAFATYFFLPFAAALPMLLLAGFVPLVAYAIRHNQSVESHQRVFTRDWWRYEMAELASGMGMKVNLEKQAEYAKGAAVDFEARGAGDPTKNKANLLTARQSPGFVVAKEMIAQMVRRRSDQTLLDYRAESVAVKHFIDGVWHSAEPIAREDGDVTLAVLKQLASLNPKERQKKQVGEIGAKFQGTAYNVEIASQGVKTGERVILKLEDTTKTALKTFTDLGMREKIREQWSEMLALDHGVLVLSAPPGAGMTTLVDISLLESDRLMRDVFSVEDVNKPEREIENVVVHTYDSKQGQTPASILEKLIRLYPNAYVVREFGDPETAKGYINESSDGKLVITSAPASEATEALLRVLKNKAPHREFTEQVAASLNMRLIRKLCDACKVAYEPSPDMLKKLGIPAGKVTQLYRVPNEEEQKKPCEKCGGVGYYGRTGLFELLVVDDKVREVLLKQPKMELLKKAARAAHMRSHQEEGILLVAKGTTSLQELQRVLKG